jgi:hypothetical protein
MSNIEALAEMTWNKVYSDRRKWSDIGQSARDEWIKVFTQFEKFRIQESFKSAFAESPRQLSQPYKIKRR